MARLITYRGKAWTAEAHSSIIGDGATRTKVTFTRQDTGDTAKGWVQGSMKDFDTLPVGALSASLDGALGPKKALRDWE